MKKPERSRQSFRLMPLDALETRALMTMTAATPLPNLEVSVGSVPAAITLDNYLKDDKATANDYANINTSLGTIPVLLTPQTTPTTVSNFLSYVNKGDYNNTLVHRSVPGFIWQAGGYQLNSSSNITPITPSSPIKNEFGASNTRGTIAMAKVGNNPNSATSQFFFNESDSNAANLDHQNGGFTVFGHVVSPQGLAVMDAISAIPVPTSSPLASPLNEAPLQYYTAGKPVQAYNLTLINNITTASEVYTATSDNTNIATATVTSGQLAIVPVSQGVANVSVVGYGADGVAATESFTVDVVGPAQGATQPISASTPSLPAPTPASSSPPIPIAPTSALIPSAQGSTPSTVVAGQRTKIQQTVTLESPSTDFIQQERVSLSLSTNGATPDYQIASTSTSVKLKMGKQSRLTVTANRIGANVPPGVYHLVVSVTDPDGLETTTNTGKTIIVKAATPKILAR